MNASRLADAIELLPHREPFRLISKIVHLEEQSGEGRWSLTGNEDFFRGHFPGCPIVPGVLIVESLAQFCGLVGLVRRAGAPGRHGGRLAHVDVRFDRPVTPPAEIVLRARQTRALGALYQFEVEALVSDQTVARGQITLAEAFEP